MAEELARPAVAEVGAREAELVPGEVQHEQPDQHRGACRPAAGEDGIEAAADQAARSAVVALDHDHGHGHARREHVEVVGEPGAQLRVGWTPGRRRRWYGLVTETITRRYSWATTTMAPSATHWRRRRRGRSPRLRRPMAQTSAGRNR